VLCSRGGQSTVIVINGVSGAILARLNRRSDEIYLVYDGAPENNRFLYCRRLETEAPSSTGFCFEDYARDCPCKGTTYD